MSSSANIYTILITVEKDKSLHSILAYLYICLSSLTQYLVFLAFIAEPSLMGVSVVQGGLGGQGWGSPSLVVWAFFGGRPQALGILVVACFTVLSSRILALGGHPH